MIDAPQNLDPVGIGIGPSNLSLAALTSKEPGLTDLFIDHRKSFAWHPGLILPMAQMQTHFLQDHVTPADSTSPYLFLAFPVATRRFYHLLVTGRSKVLRQEFEQCCQWVAARLDSFRFWVQVEAVDWNGTEQFMCRPHDFAGKRVAVVGGGQSDAEVVHYLLTSDTRRPEDTLWGTRRTNLLPLDDSSFVDELYLPDYSHHFYGLPEAEREEVINRLCLTSDGISIPLLEDLYRQLYDLDVRHDTHTCSFLLEHSLSNLTENSHGLAATWQPLRGGEPVRATVGFVVCPAGDEHGMPDVLLGLKDRLALSNGTPAVRRDFSLEWDGRTKNLIFVQSTARREYGVADPNLSLLARRSAMIANSLLGGQRYDQPMAAGSAAESALNALLNIKSPRAEGEG